MELFYAIINFLEDTLQDLQKTAPDYREARALESRLLGLLTEAAGADLVEKLTDAQSDRAETDKLYSFLYGLRLGMELLRL